MFARRRGMLTSVAALMPGAAVSYAAPFVVLNDDGSTQASSAGSYTSQPTTAACRAGSTVIVFVVEATQAGIGFSSLTDSVGGSGSSWTAAQQSTKVFGVLAQYIAVRNLAYDLPVGSTFTVTLTGAGAGKFTLQAICLEGSSAAQTVNSTMNASGFGGPISAADPNAFTTTPAFEVVQASVRQGGASNLNTVGNGFTAISGATINGTGPLTTAVTATVALQVYVTPATAKSTMTTPVNFTANMTSATNWTMAFVNATSR